MTPGPSRTSPERLRKYTKSERTHEENQERAYIAASRRSDRSLEARMESARRASEIHRRRCGRGFRITEEAVLNEEMYEEEDPDYGHRIQRLYSALANDSAILQQQWLRAQWLMLGQNNGKFAPGYTAPQGLSSPQGMESVPFFAYQPGPQPSSTPIRPSQQQLSPQSTSTEQFGAVQESKIATVFKLDQQRASHPYMRSQDISKQEQPVSPTSQSVVSPISSIPAVRFGSGTALDMAENGPAPFPAQLNLFTYPPNSLGGDINYTQNQSVSTTTGSDPNAHATFRNVPVDSPNAASMSSNFPISSPSIASYSNPSPEDQQQPRFFSPTPISTQKQHQALYTNAENYTTRTISSQASPSASMSYFQSPSTSQSFNVQPASDGMTTATTNDVSSTNIDWGGASFEHGGNDIEAKGVIYDDWLAFPLSSQS